MGVLYTENFCDNYNEKVKFLNNVQLSYKPDAVYKDCSYDLPIKERQRHLTRLKCINRILTSSLSMNRQPKPKKPIEKMKPPVEDFFMNYIDNLPTKSDEPIDVETHDSKITCELAMQDSEACASVTAVVEEPDSPTSSKKWKRMLRPRLVCPCCGGGDDGELPMPYAPRAVAAAAADSYETIALGCSNTGLSHLDLKESLMSMIHLQRRPKKTPLFYAKIAKYVLRNSYKSTVGAMEPFNFKPWC